MYKNAITKTACKIYKKEKNNRENFVRKLSFARNLLILLRCRVYDKVTEREQGRRVRGDISQINGAVQQQWQSFHLCGTGMTLPCRWYY